MSKESGIILTRLRELLEKTQEQVADDIKSSQSVVSRHERTGVFGRKALERYAKYYRVSTSVITGEDPIPENYPFHSPAERNLSNKIQQSSPSASASLPHGAVPVGPLVSLPFYEEIVGDPLVTQQTPDGFAVVDTNLIDKNDLDNYFWLKVKDDSMIGETLRPGGRVLVHRGTDSVDGDIVVVKVHNTAPIIRKVKHAGDMLILMPANSSYEACAVSRNDAQVIGRIEIVLSFVRSGV
jgi:SOS-response transcriptional repressor LexA